MRRLIALFLLAAFLLQATGSAATPSVANPQAPPITSQVVAAIMVAKGNLANTFIGAALTGTMSRYAAMHDTAPDFSSLVRHRQVDLTPLRQHAVATARVASGVRVDPLNGMNLMRPPTPSAIRAATAGLRAAAAFRMPQAPIARAPLAPAASAVRAQGRRAMLVDTSVAGTTGINRYWSYEEGAIPGSGKYMVNVANGNVLVEGDDVDIPERGIDLTFRRMYNSQSGHDWDAADGSTVGNYGGGWSNSADSHLGYDATRNVISWYDIDGARYDYTCSGTVCTAPAGQYAAMTYDAGCGYWITKKSGTAYHFWAPAFNATITPGCTAAPGPFGGVLGRVVAIWARDQQNNLQFTYAWDGGDESSASHLAQITVAHSDGQSLVLTFGDVNAQRVLLSILRPDGKYIRYGYDSAIELTDVCTPGNGNTDAYPGTPCVDPHATHHRYGYTGGANGHRIAWADSPNFTMNNGATAPNGFLNFYFDTSSRVSAIDQIGVFNYTPGDGTGALLQPSAPTGTQELNETGYTYASGLTTVADTDGHSTKYTFDTLGRVTQRQAWQGTEYLTSTSAWDAQNNLVASTDARGNETDYAYDLQGNTIAVAAPSVATNVGTLRPTTLLSYDSFNNVIASCDPASVGATGFDWVGLPRDSHCATRTYKTSYTYNYSDPNEPFGMLTDTATPLGYHHQILYSSGAQGGDFGLPSDVIGDSVGTQADGSTRQPHQTFTYDAHGNLATYSAGTGTWTLAYDTTMNRMTSTTDADGVTNRTCYLDNGQVSATQTAAQYAADGSVCGAHSVAMTYDADGNEVTETHHFSDIAGTTTKYYDGMDRLVEVVQPHDSRTISSKPVDEYSYAWMTRYFYDLTAGGTVAIGGVSSLKAYGNLFKTQEYLPSSPVMLLTDTPGSPGWSDVRGTAFDPLDRATASYELAFGTTPKLTNIYDQVNPLTGADGSGLMAKSQNAMGAVTIPTYDADGKTVATNFQSDGGLTPNRTSIVDPDGRPTAMSSVGFSNETFAYDADGRLTTHTDPTGTGYSSPVTSTYAYYADGQRKSLSVSSTALSATNLFTYSYFVDGALKTEGLGGGMTGAFSWTYTPAGRELTQSDPYTGTVIPMPSGTWTLVPRTQHYDAYGRVDSLELPEGFTYSSIAYDAEGEKLSESRYLGGGTGMHVGDLAQSYSVRGELVGQSLQGVGLTPTQQWSYESTSWNGVMDCSGPVDPTTHEAPCNLKIDARSSMTLRTNIGDIGYDAAGRSITTSDTSTSTNVMTRAYDAENHLATQTYSGPGGQYTCHDATCPGPPVADGVTPPTTLANGSGATYAWGPSGHLLALVSSGPMPGWGNEHWDGDSVLLEQSTTTGGLQTDLQIGKMAVAPVAPTIGELSIADRDLSGNIVATHTAHVFSGFSDVRGYKIRSKAFGLFDVPSPGASLSDQSELKNDFTNPVLSASREDGYADAWGNVFQGVRVYDPTMAQWTAPDAYAGDAHDPMSQKPFMWNGNNPLDFEDPSGFKPAIDGGTDKQRAQVQTAIDDIIAKGSKAADQNSEIAKLARLLSDPSENVTIHILSDSGTSAGSDANVATINVDSFQSAKCTCDVSIHEGSLAAITAGKDGAASAAIALEQGIANDVSVSYAMRTMGGMDRKAVGGAFRADQKYMEKNPAVKNYDQNQDDWVNKNILTPLGLPDDI